MPPAYHYQMNDLLAFHHSLVHGLLLEPVHFSDSLPRNERSNRMSSMQVYFQYDLLVLLLLNQHVAFPVEKHGLAQSQHHEVQTDLLLSWPGLQNIHLSNLCSDRVSKIRLSVLILSVLLLHLHDQTVHLLVKQILREASTMRDLPARWPLHGLS